MQIGLYSDADAVRQRSRTSRRLRHIRSETAGRRNRRSDRRRPLSIPDRLRASTRPADQRNSLSHQPPRRQRQCHGDSAQERRRASCWPCSRWPSRAAAWSRRSSTFAPLPTESPPAEFCLAILASLWIAARVSRPIEQLARAAEEVAAGNWETSVPERKRAAAATRWMCWRAASIT